MDPTRCTTCHRRVGISGGDDGAPPVDLDRCARAGGFECLAVAQAVLEMRQRAESAELGCEIAYRREPTQAEGDAHAPFIPPSGAPDDGGDMADECFVPMGGWTGRRCHQCHRWVWGGPTLCRPSCHPDEAQSFLEFLRYGGTIVSSATLTVEQIAIARASDRLFVDEQGYGYIYVPGPHGDIP